MKTLETFPVVLVAAGLHGFTAAELRDAVPKLDGALVRVWSGFDHGQAGGTQAAVGHVRNARYGGFLDGASGLPMEGVIAEIEPINADAVEVMHELAARGFGPAMVARCTPDRLILRVAAFDLVEAPECGGQFLEASHV